LDKVRGIINTPFEEFKNELVASQIISQNLIDGSFVNVVLDQGYCSEFGEIINSSVTDFHTLDISKFDKVIVSCRQGYKSSAVSSYYPYKI
jgi:hypothetical protein